MIYSQRSTEHFEFLLPSKKTWFSPKEMAEVIGKTSQYVRDAFDNQKILGHSSNGRSSIGREQRRHYLILRENVLLFLLETANYDPEDFMDRVGEILSNRTPSQLLQLQEKIGKIITGTNIGRFSN